MAVLPHEGMQRSDDLRRANSARVLRAIRDSSQVSRTDLAQLTQLSPATISTIINGLFGAGAVREADQTGGAIRRGRPQVALELDPMAGSVLTVALSLNSATIRVHDFAGALILERLQRIETLHADPSAIIGNLASTIQAAIVAMPRSAPSVRQISMGIQGVADISNRVLLWSPITKGSVDLANGLEKRLNMPVTIANDCDVTAVALQHMQDGGQGGDFVAITHTRGIGMSMVIGGRLFSGVRSSAAEFGHMVFEHDGALCRCGRRGCIEAYAGDYAIWRNANGISPDSPPPGEIDRADLIALAERAMQSDGPERRAFQLAARAIGVGLKNVYALIDPAPLAMVGFGDLAPTVISTELRAILADVFTVSPRAPIAISWYPNADHLISLGAAQRGLEALEQRISASAATTIIAAAAE
jgi:predicted NBD/HSP70 family sugar kinase